MIGRRKPQRGVCRVCGCAVVQPTKEALVEQGYLLHQDGRFWINGHLFESHDYGLYDLVDVVCYRHCYDKDLDPRHPAGGFQ